MNPLTDIVLPVDQVEGTRSQVQRWLKSVGQPVTRHEPLVEIETDKVTVEVPSPADGVLDEIVAAEGTDVAPGAVLGRLRPSAASTGAGRRTAAVASPPTVAAVSPERRPAVQTAGGMRVARLSPAVRRLLEERGLSPGQVQGTGDSGRITVDDVLAAGTAAALPDGSPALPPAAEPSDKGLRRVPHTPMRRRIAAHMVASLLQTAPHVTTVFQADLSAVLAHRAKHKPEFERRGIPLTLTAYFVAACVDAIRAVPEANGRWTEDALLIHERIDIGVATALEGRGLVVPVIRDVAKLDLAGIARSLGELVERARDDRLTQAELGGGTFTISNHGVSGSLVAAPIVIHQPQSAILGVGKLEQRAVVAREDDRDAVVIRPCCFVTLTIDHRVLDGHRANRFMQALIHGLEGWSG